MVLVGICVIGTLAELRLEAAVGTGGDLYLSIGLYVWVFE